MSSAVESAATIISSVRFIVFVVSSFYSTYANVPSSSSSSPLLACNGFSSKAISHKIVRQTDNMNSHDRITWPWSRGDPLLTIWLCYPKESNIVPPRIPSLTKLRLLRIAVVAVAVRDAAWATVPMDLHSELGAIELHFFRVLFYTLQWVYIVTMQYRAGR